MKRVLLPVVLVLFAGCEPSSAQKTPQPPPTSTTSAEPSASPEGWSPSPADAAAGAEKTLFVREVLVDCEGEGPMKCMQVRDSEKDEWTLFYGAIEGFTFEAGYAYELRVRVENLAKAPADAPTRRVRLVTVVSKKKAAK